MTMTQMQAARAGKITDEMKIVAQEEKMDINVLKERVANGTIAICANINHKNLHPYGVGEGLCTKVNANIGTSSAFPDPEPEIEKLNIAIAAGAHSVMDLSTGNNIDASRRAILDNSTVMVGPFAKENPQQLLMLHAVRNDGWLTLRQTPVAVSALPKIPEGKKLVITLVYRQKMENVSGRAFATLEFYDGNAKRIWFYDDKPLSGSSDWTSRSVKRALTAIPEGARWFGISFHLGKSSGKVEFLNPRLDISIQ